MTKSELEKRIRHTRRAPYFVLAATLVMLSCFLFVLGKDGHGTTSIACATLGVYTILTVNLFARLQHAYKNCLPHAEDR